MKKTFITLINTLFTVLLFAQTTQSGLIQEYREENDKRPLQGVEIEIKHAQSTVSDKKGKFMLEFRTLTPGKKVNVRRIEKLGYEIFNKEALEQWNINPEEPFTIVMVRQDVFKKIKDHYNKISSKSYAEQHARERAKLEKELEDGKITVEKYNDQFHQLEEWYERQLDNIDNYVDRFARIDLNKLDTEERKIIALIEQGNLSAAIEAYNQLDLLAKYKAEYDDQRILLQANEQIQKKIAEKNKNMNTTFAMIKRQISTYQIGGRQDDFAKIDSIYTKLVEINPHDIDICLSYLGFLTFQCEYNKAYDMGMHIIKGDYTQSQYASCVSYLAEILFRRKNMTEAERYALQALHYYDEASEEYYELLELLAAIYSDSDQTDKANDIYNKMIELSANHIERKVTLLENLAFRYDVQGKYEIAKQLRKDCLHLLDSLPEDTIELAQKYFDSYTYQRWKAVVQTNLGKTYLSLGDYDNALNTLLPVMDQLRYLTTRNPDHNNQYLYYALNTLGNIYFYQNNFEQCKESFRQALMPISSMYAKDSVVYSDEYAMLLNNLGYINYSTKNYDQSYEYYKQSLELRRIDYKRLPNANYKYELARILLNLSLLCEKTQSYSQCIEYASEALGYIADVYSMYPDIFDIKRNYLWDLRLLAVSYQNLGDNKMSQQYMDQLYNLDSKDPYVYDVQGEIYLIKGDINKARKMWEKVLDLEPNYLDKIAPESSVLHDKLQALGYQL